MCLFRMNQSLFKRIKRTVVVIIYTERKRPILSDTKEEHRPLSLDNSRCNINEGGGYYISDQQFSFLNFKTQN